MTTTEPNTTDTRRAVVIDDTLLANLEVLASWPDTALAAWLDYDDPRIERGPTESDDDYHQRCVERWTASGSRAEAEEAAADHAAGVAQSILEVLRTPDTSDHSPAFSIDHAKLREWWNGLIGDDILLVGEIYESAAFAVEDFIHDGPWLLTALPWLRLQAHLTSEDGIVDGFVLAIWDSAWHVSPFGLCVATGHIASNEVDRHVDPVEFASSIIDIANSLYTSAIAEPMIKATP